MCNLLNSTSRTILLTLDLVGRSSLLLNWWPPIINVSLVYEFVITDPLLETACTNFPRFSSETGCGLKPKPAVRQQLERRQVNVHHQHAGVLDLAEQRAQFRVVDETGHTGPGNSALNVINKYFISRRQFQFQTVVGRGNARHARVELHSHVLGQVPVQERHQSLQSVADGQHWEPAQKPGGFLQIERWLEHLGRTIDPCLASMSTNWGRTLFALSLPASPAYTPCMMALTTLSETDLLNRRVTNCSTVSSLAILLLTNGSLSNPYTSPRPRGSNRNRKNEGTEYGTGVNLPEWPSVSTYGLTRYRLLAKEVPEIPRRSFWALNLNSRSSSRIIPLLPPRTVRGPFSRIV
ncbi:hypothetical protein OGAPHI_005725 [Ogataea philodendri]|uniref:Uncharacterized protein n=1 Tax=Ogataea philodendri TaxID=1378263 RepID=A0A9P8NYX8_9ASCO|nr:uncharacterized protein OGAPHI_005725 [Ogataea philodendri]KAH3662473.1 hypothetical protein OGAPHI_005725 [Ogataea philodendri]